mmetsp:Transcript_10791/g.43673  ORF Transcript_10791/g.43673 Transcript_10791/m.43673 type:complete len:483 (+) Transcript_10791:497-1945(+)
MQRVRDRRVDEHVGAARARGRVDRGVARVGAEKGLEPRVGVVLGGVAERAGHAERGAVDDAEVVEGQRRDRLDGDLEHDRVRGLGVVVELAPRDGLHDDVGAARPDGGRRRCDDGGVSPAHPQRHDELGRHPVAARAGRARDEDDELLLLLLCRGARVADLGGGVVSRGRESSVGRRVHLGVEPRIKNGDGARGVGRERVVEVGDGACRARGAEDAARIRRRIPELGGEHAVRGAPVGRLRLGHGHGGRRRGERRRRRRRPHDAARVLATTRGGLVVLHRGRFGAPIGAVPRRGRRRGSSLIPRRRRRRRRGTSAFGRRDGHRRVLLLLPRKVFVGERGVVAKPDQKVALGRRVVVVVVVLLRHRPGDGDERQALARERAGRRDERVARHEERVVRVEAVVAVVVREPQARAREAQRPAARRRGDLPRPAPRPGGARVDEDRLGIARSRVCAEERVVVDGHVELDDLSRRRSVPARRRLVHG